MSLRFLSQVTDFSDLRNYCVSQKLILSANEENKDEIVEKISKFDKELISWCNSLLCRYYSMHIRKQQIYFYILTKLNGSYDDYKKASPQLIHMLFKQGKFTLNDCRSLVDTNDEVRFFFSRDLGIKQSDFHDYKELSDEEIDEVIEFCYPKNSIEYAIKFDDIDLLQNICAGIDFDISKKVKKNASDGIFMSDELTAIELAAACGSLQCFKYLFMNNATIDENVAEYAIIGGNIEIIHICEQHGCTFANGAKTALLYHRNDVYDWLILRGPRDEGNLLIASKARNPIAVVFFVANGQDVNQVDEFQNSSLCYLAMFNDLPIFKYLVAHGASKDHRTMFADNVENIARMSQSNDIIAFCSELKNV